MIFTGLAKVGMGVEEYGHHFSTGLPVHLNWKHILDRAEDFGSRFQQDIEPVGRYVLHDPDPDIPRHGWEQGKTLLECPLVIPFNLHHGCGYDGFSWKHQLSEAFDRVTGINLSLMLLNRGFDGVVTVELTREDVPYDTREIVLFHEVHAVI
jgi:hypothetical protein